MLKKSLICCFLSWAIIVLFVMASFVFPDDSKYELMVLFIEIPICVILNGVALVLLSIDTIRAIHQKRKLRFIFLRLASTLFVIMLVIPIFLTPFAIGSYLRPSDDIFEAISRSREKEVFSFLEHQPELLNSRDSGGYTLLHEAAGYNNKQLVDDFISRGLDPNARTRDGLTPLHSAASSDGRGDLKGATRTIEPLIEAGADVNAIDLEGRTPLHYAAGGGFYKTVKLLLAHGAKPDIKSEDGMTPLNAAKKQLAVQLRGGHHSKQWTRCIELLQAN